MKNVHWRMLPIVLFAVLIVFFWRGLSLDPHHLPSVRIDQALPNFELPSLSHPQETLKTADFHHRVSLLIVWASWCTACLEENVFLLQLKHDGIPLYGLNYKDHPKDALRWLKEWGNPFLKTGSDEEGRVAIDLGVYGAPETFLVDQQGIIRYRYAGVLDALVWEKEFLPRIKALALIRPVGHLLPKREKGAFELGSGLEKS